MSGQRAPPRPNQSPHHAYNPQDYAPPQSPHSSSYSPQQYSSANPPPLPPPPRDYRPYNPAAYHDSSSIANAANQLYGSPSPSFGTPATQTSPFQHQYSPSQPQQQQPPQPPYSPRSPSYQHNAQMSPDISSYRNHNYSASVPQPQPRPYNATSPDYSQPHASGNSYFADPPYPQHSPIPGPTHHLPAPPLPPHHSPSPDFITHGHERDGSDALNITSAFPRPPVANPNVSPDPADPQQRHRAGSRPLPNPPQRAGTFFDEDDRSYGRPERDSVYENQQIQADLFDQVESALNIGSFAPGPGHSDGQYGDPPQSATFGTSYFGDYGDDDSDAEAAAGLEAMRMAEQQEHEELRRRTMTAQEVAQANGQFQDLQSPTEEARFEDEDYGNVDMSMLGGGFSVDMPYVGPGPAGPGPRASDNLTATQELQNGLNSYPSVSSRGTAASGNSGSTLQTDTLTAATSLTTPANRASARVDESGTGGLSDPLPPRRQMSFDADDERQYLNQPQDNYPIPEAYYPPPHQQSSRPLPSLPQGEVPSQSEAMYPTSHYNQQQQQQQQQQAAYVDPGSVLPRSHSLGVHSTTSSQQTLAPARAKTDAEERKRILALRASQQGLAPSAFQNFDVASEDLDLPSLPTGRRLQPSKLSSAHYDRCKEPWAMSALTEWVRSIAEGDSELRRHSVEEALVNLFTTKVPTLNIAMAESLSAQTVDEMLSVGSLILEEEWLRFGPDTPSGVLFQLTNRGCYGQVVHERDGTGRCYSHHCQRTERKIDISGDKSTEMSEQWATFWNLGKAELEQSGRDKKEIEMQNNLHEIIAAEYKFMHDLNILKTLYRDGLQKKKDVMSPKTLNVFISSVFGKLDALQKANEDHLLPQLKYRQKEQGPWIVGVSDIFRDWIRKAKNAYIEYTANFPSAEFLVRQEDRKNLLFHTFLDEMRNHSSAGRLDIWHYLKVPITKIQRYSLLLGTVLKNMKTDSEEKTNLAIAIAEIQEATRECNSRLAEESRKVDLLDLKGKLHLRPEMKHVELNLTQWGRELIHTGDVQRVGSSRFTWLDTRAILLDNYLVLAKTVSNRDTKTDMYDVSKMPIPMDLLVLETADEDPIVKSTMKGIAVGTATSKATNLPQDARVLTRANTSQSPKPGTPNSLATSNTTGASSGMVTTTSLEPSNTRDEKVLYPFKVRHLGKEVYQLFAATSGARKEWADKLIEAKTRHAASLFAQNAEPFRLRVVADTAFAYDQAMAPQKSVTIKGTPLHRAIEDVERQFASSGRPAPVCRARVNCATTFKQSDGKQVTAIGTDYGVYLSEVNNPRGWTRAIPALRVTQVAVLEEFGIFLLISDKSLIAYHLDVVCSGATGNSASDSMKKAPQKLSGAKDVGFFATGRMKDRTLVFYEKRDGRSSVFKILEPVYKKSTPMAKSRHWGFRGQTDFFRDFDDFYIPTDCSALDLFQTSLSVATARGFEILNLEKKTPWSVPDLKAPHVATIAQRLHGLDPVAMFRLAADGSELLCVYAECAVYVNKYGDVSRSVVMEFVGHARNAALVAGFLVLFDTDFIEVRDALNGRLKQVVAGRDVRCLDSGRGQSGIVNPNAGMAAGADGRSVKFALQHPENERSQIVVELVLNESRRV